MQCLTEQFSLSSSYKFGQKFSHCVVTSCPAQKPKERSWERCFWWPLNIKQSFVRFVGQFCRERPCVTSYLKRFLQLLSQLARLTKVFKLKDKYLEGCYTEQCSAHLTAFHDTKATISLTDDTNRRAGSCRQMFQSAIFEKLV